MNSTFTAVAGVINSSSSALHASSVADIDSCKSTRQTDGRPHGYDVIHLNILSGRLDADVDLRHDRFAKHNHNRLSFYALF